MKPHPEIADSSRPKRWKAAAVLSTARHVVGFVDAVLGSR